MSVYKVRGVGGELEVFEDKVTLAPKGALGFLTKGLKGTKSIPFESITGIQHKKAGIATNGYIQFSMPEATRVEADCSPPRATRTRSCTKGATTL